MRDAGLTHGHACFLRRAFAIRADCMRYLRIYAGDGGASRFEDVELQGGLLPIAYFSEVGCVCHLCFSPADLAGIHWYGRWDDFGRIVPKIDC